MTEDTLFKFQFSFDPKHCYMARSCKAEYSLLLTVRTNGIRRGSSLLRVMVYNFQAASWSLRYAGLPLSMKKSETGTVYLQIFSERV